MVVNATVASPSLCTLERGKSNKSHQKLFIRSHKFQNYDNVIKTGFPKSVAKFVTFGIFGFSRKSQNVQKNFRQRLATEI